MSHFAVAVFHRPDQKIEELLAPFNEQDEQYMVFVPCEETEEEIHATYQENVERYDNFEDFMDIYYGYHQNESGQWGCLENPHAKWDWWDIGGRYSNQLTLTNGEKKNEAAVSSVNWHPDPDKYRRASRFWEIHVEDSPLKGTESKDEFAYNPQYYIAQYGTKEHYAETQALPVLPWAFLTPDGEWVQTGDMGWWAMNNATKDSRDGFKEAFLDYVKKNPGLMITIVDCHI